MAVTMKMIREAAKMIPVKGRTRIPIKYEYKKGTKWVRERLVEPEKCEEEWYLTVTYENTRGPAKPPPGVHIVNCCPRGYKRLPGDPGVCVMGSNRAKPFTQSIRHHRERFKIRHAELWKKILTATPDERGMLVLPVGVAAAGAMEGFGTLFGEATPRFTSLQQWVDHMVATGGFQKEEERRLEKRRAKAKMYRERRKERKAQEKAARSLSDMELRDDQATAAFLAMQVPAGYKDLGEPMFKIWE